jgi:tetratricopeptide (TPR) repeat protein
LRRISWTRINVALFATALVLLAALAIQGKLAWSVDALELYASGSTTTPREVVLEREARALLQRGGDAEEIRRLLDRATTIDPHSPAVYLTGELDLREGRDDAALARFEHWLEIDPTWLPAYWRIAEIHRRRGDLAARREVLRRGLDYFTSEVDRFVPQTDDSVPVNFNDKAIAVYNGYLEAIALLREALAEPVED